MKKTALIIMIITLISKFVGFAREIVLSYYFGTSSVTDVYLVSMTIPTVIIGFIAAGLATAYIPMLTQLLHNEGKEEANKYTSNLVNILLFFLTILLAAGLVFTKELLQIFAYGFSQEMLAQGIIFTRILLFSMYFTLLISLSVAYLQVHNNFIIPALIGFPLSVVSMIGFFLAFKGNYFILALGSLTALMVQFLFIYPFAKKEGFNYSFLLNFKDEKIKRTLYIAAPVILGSSIDGINTIVDRTIASTLIVGGISALNYSHRLIGFAVGLFIIPIIDILYPTISKFASQSNIAGLKKTIKEGVTLILIFVMPITLGAVIFAGPIVEMIYGRGVFDQLAVQLTSATLLFYSLGILGLGVREVIARGFYAFQDSRTPMINGLIGVILNIVLNILLSRYMGLAGLALATSISVSLVSLLLIRSFIKKYGSLGMKEVSLTFLKLGLASLIMGFLAKGIYDYFYKVLLANTPALLLAIGSGALVYFTIIYFMKIRDVDIVVEAIKAKMGKF